MPVIKIDNLLVIVICIGKSMFGIVFGKFKNDFKKLKVYFSIY